MLGSNPVFSTFKLAVSSLEGVSTVQGPLQSNQRSSSLCLYSKWGMWAFKIKGLGLWWKYTGQFISRNLINLTMSSVIPQPWAIKHCPHLNQMLEHIPGFSGMKKSTSYFRYAILAKPWACKWKHLSLQVQPLDNILVATHTCQATVLGPDF